MKVDYMFEEGEEVYQPIGMAVACLVLGLLSLIFFLTGLNIVTAIIAIILGIIFIATRRGKRGKLLAKLGIAASVLSIALFWGSMVYMAGNYDNVLSLEEEALQLYLGDDYYTLYGQGDSNELDMDLEDLNLDNTL